MTDLNPLRENEVEARNTESLAVKSAMMNVLRDASGAMPSSRVVYRMAVAAILRLDQVREGRGK